ncbi:MULTISPECIES: sulfate/molybdate ABC transporter ATP-binding protein [unclassified Lentimicrobium]|uniref:sulfate/molybdate ABC transporter ATP-binding protein n=1 Tax=unclassified Lentimicrobium TaxID=2677434 RepID=UPI0015523FD5|nr:MULTISPECIES: ATP-binding cassette domain-containing protein [unclassified Lentimicrobium]NPD44620.1 ATP-binding cassette domain-containing protein [Lentimicrobium sp. S6]NPD83332.1 ATP-binding cassette domain-containing protein [Lentimicrobium sp. L6]
MIKINLQKQLNAANGFLQINVDMEIEKGQLVTIYGESGAGKTSILRMLAGLMEADSGLIKVNDAIWLNEDKGLCLKPQQRRIGFVFQDYALFPNMTVKDNLSFALEKGQDKNIVEELIDFMELGDLQLRHPDKLSGGQKQRVALARALVRKPEILLLDEPLSALDAKMRTKLQDYILKVHRKYHLTTLLISHEVGEVIKMADKIFILEQGKIAKQGKPIDVFSSKQISGKFQFSGEIVQIAKEEIIYIVTVLIGANFVKIVAEENEISTMKVGDKVIVASKAFNPILRKIT